MKFFKKKNDALEKKTTSEMLCNSNITSYFLLDDYTSFLDLIYKTQTKSIPKCYEFISEKVPVNLFLDLDFDKQKTSTIPNVLFDNVSNIILFIKMKIKTYLSSMHLTSQFIVLESNSDTKYSYHIIVRVRSANEQLVVFKTVHVLKQYILQDLFGIKHFILDNCTFNLVDLGIIDTSVYREGLFRTIYSTKHGEKRPFIKSNLGDDFQDIESFVAFTPPQDNCTIIDDTWLNVTNTITLVDTHVATTVPSTVDDVPCENLHVNDIKVIRHFIRRNYSYKIKDIHEIKLDTVHNCIIIALKDLFCKNVDKEHKSNHQYIVVNANESKKKCHDPECCTFKDQVISFEDFDNDMKTLISKIFNMEYITSDIVKNVSTECEGYITNNFDPSAEPVQYDKISNLFHSKASDKSLVRINGRCQQCQALHQITADGYVLKCQICNITFPLNQPILLKGNKVNTIHQFFNLNNFNITINNYNNGEASFDYEVMIDYCIFKDKKFTNLIRECLNGHKVTKIAQLMQSRYNEFVFSENSWFYFDGHMWHVDYDSIKLKLTIWNLANAFIEIENYYKNKVTPNNDNIKLLENIKCLVNKLNKPGFKKEIVEDCKLFYYTSNFINKLDCKKSLVAFTNGVYDLHAKLGSGAVGERGCFRKSTKEDYISMSVGYDYDDSIRNPSVYDFIHQILPDKQVRDYVLKKFSDCLDGNIPNTKFLMFIGDGANGKSQLLNLMKRSLGEYGEKVEVTLLTRKRNNANEASSEKAKLMNKRFAFLSEPEDGEKINISLLKELTGSEELIARHLFKSPISFIMEAKLFLACNELPQIKGEDTALWRRIRVIDFPSRFVETPKEHNEFKIDYKVPSFINDDITWRQTFMNILLEYYHRNDIVEPQSIQYKTQEYRQENDEFDTWCKENIKQGDSSHFLSINELCNGFFGYDESNVKKNNVKKKFETYLKKNFPLLSSDMVKTSIKNITSRGWWSVYISK